ncbi:Resolvase domain protein (plasmid) [Hoyosella subflava DQS3-9A1]|uniref:Resolvase domain protein n=1 Tax=Hoyosella subflava (strain DSM 45089 / JCM 17490 / NBRC 109087 / DQS3-9A1) TaxID=443218 RepID=F6ESB5_HOYSD|nr:Resolvase domain protein [Hoyosella subflava DQS3-9A1]
MLTSNNSGNRCLIYLVRTAIANRIIEPGISVTVPFVATTGTLVGYARCSTDEQDLTAQRQQLRDLGVSADRIYLDHGLTGTNRARPGLDQALAAVRAGDTLVVPKLDRLARSVPDARAIGDDLATRGIKLSLGGQIYDPTDPMGKMFFNILATFAEFEVDLLRMRTREGMVIARAKGRLKGRQPKLTTKQQTELRRMHASGNYTITDLAELFNISRPTVYRTLRPAESGPA